MIQLNTGRVLQAIDLVMTLHKEQKRKGRNVPYITHLFSVASKVLEEGGDEDQFISALLHDSVEDQSQPTKLKMADRFIEVLENEREIDVDSFRVSWMNKKEENKDAFELLKKIEIIFGSKVAYYVIQCSDSFTYPKKPWKQRKEEFIDRCYSMSSDVKLIIACDKWHNLYSLYHDYCRMGDDIWSQFNGKKEGTLWYYREILRALKKDWQHPILSELEFYLSCLLEK
ncbi:MAG: HD domain-containing protein [Candidatus Hydrogenedens sp.]